MKIDKKFVLREIAGEYIIIPTGKTALNFNGLITVNEVGVSLWNMLQDEITFDGLVQGILDEYEVEEDVAREDIQEFLDALIEGGILTGDEKSRSGAQYEPLRDGLYYIDKTDVLEKGMAAFPSIYITGAAASGKTTAVRMLVAKHPEVEYTVFWMDEEQEGPSRFLEKLKKLRASMARERFWVIFENLPGKLPSEIAAGMAGFLCQLPEECRAVLTGRECPELEFLKLIWKRRMELVSQKTLLFTKKEISGFAEYTKSPLDPEEIYKETGGWAGCVDLMIRMSLAYEGERCSAQKLRQSYEIDTYIQNEIIGTLSMEEQETMRRAAVCPWLDEKLCADVWGQQWAAENLEKLGRKGMLVCDSRQKHWRIASLFRKNYSGSLEPDEGKKQSSRFWIKLGSWYDSHGFVRDALYCLKLSGNEKEIRSCMIRNYKKIPFLEVEYDEVMGCRENLPEICYLRGMYCYFQQNMEGLDREISRIRKLDFDEKQKLEILLNLTYAKPDFPLTEWLDLLERSTQKFGSFSLYGVLGSSITYLCGLRDLSGLFACSRKEENRRARIWKECLGKEEYICYCLARLDYYLEIRQKDAIREEDWDILSNGTEQDCWQFRLVRLYLLCKLQSIRSDPEAAEQIRLLHDSLLLEESACCVQNTEVIRNLFFYWNNKRDKFSLWLLRSGDNYQTEMSKNNYFALFYLAKGYMMLNQYEKAGKIQKKLISYLHFYRRSYLLAEVLFQQAIVNWVAGSHSQALRCVIESFIVNGDFRYVRMYTEYGSHGCDVLEAYIEWIRSSRPEGWHRKKKYNYGNVLRMPEEDYLEAVLRYAKREARSASVAMDKSMEEKLTMMETVILQDIGRGVSNADICKELNLKLPTVKSHIYSLYKKLNVNTRVQAVLKGKELGLLK